MKNGFNYEKRKEESNNLKVHKHTKQKTYEYAHF